MNDAPHNETRTADSDHPPPGKQFRGWRLIGVIMGVVVILALISAIVDWMVIGPLEGRMF